MSTRSRIALVCAGLGACLAWGSCFYPPEDPPATNRVPASCDWGQGISLETIRIRTSSSPSGDLNPFDSVVRVERWGGPMKLRRDPPSHLFLVIR